MLPVLLYLVEVMLPVLLCSGQVMLPVLLCSGTGDVTCVAVFS